MIIDIISGLSAVGFAGLIAWTHYRSEKAYKQLNNELCGTKAFCSRRENMIYDRFDDLQCKLNHLLDKVVELENIQQKTFEDLQGVTADLAMVRHQVTEHSDSIKKNDWTMQSWNKYLKKIEKEWPKFSLVEKRYDKLKADYREFRNTINEESKRLDKVIQEAYKKFADVGTKVALMEQNYFTATKWISDIARDFHKLAIVFKTGEIRKIKVLTEEQYMDMRGVPMFKKENDDQDEV